MAGQPANPGQRAKCPRLEPEGSNSSRPGLTSHDVLGEAPRSWHCPSSTAWSTAS